MKTKYLIINISCNRQALKEVCKHFPDEFSSIFFETLIIKTIQLVNFSILVITTKNCDTTAIFDFKEKDVQPCFHAIETTIYIITHKEVIGILSNSISTGSLPQI